MMSVVVTISMSSPVVIHNWQSMNFMSRHQLGRALHHFVLRDVGSVGRLASPSVQGLAAVH
jgi:hypothetical protein